MHVRHSHCFSSYSNVFIAQSNLLSFAVARLFKGVDILMIFPNGRGLLGVKFSKTTPYFCLINLSPETHGQL